MSTTFYPSLTTLVPVDELPDNLGVMQEVTSVISNLYYRNHQTEHSAEGDSVFHRINILAKEIKFEIPGTDGLALVFNRDASNFSNFDISVSYKWAVLKYIKGFNLNNFDFTPNSFYHLLLDIAGVNMQDLLNEVIFVLIDDPDPIDGFIDFFNTEYDPEILIRDPSPDDAFVIADLIDQVNTLHQNTSIPDDLITVIFKTVLNKEDSFGDAKSKLEILFSKWLGFFTTNDIKELLIPQVSASLNDINIALEFPTSIFQPVDTNLTESALTFTIGTILYSTENGLEFKEESSF